jgi:hypothetical protein
MGAAESSGQAAYPSTEDATSSTSSAPATSLREESFHSSIIPDVDFASAFRADKWKGELAEAQRNAMLKRIVKKTIDMNDYTTKFKSADGRPLRVEPFPLFKKKIGALGDYGCPPAVDLYLRFQIECGVLFIFMFVLALPGLISNVLRTDRRIACRDLTQSVDGYAMVTAALQPGDSNSSSAFIEELRCGWSGSPIRRNLTAPIWYLRWAIGACQEYTNATSEPLPIEAVGEGTPPLLLTPEAGYCNHGHELLSAAQHWLQFVNCLLFLGFLVRLRHVQRTAADRLDRERWTAADYTVLVRGLDHGEGVLADDSPSGELGVESKVYADLKDLGFGPERIVQVEVGRNCREEIRDIERFARLRIREQEILGRKQARAARGRAPDATEKMRDELKRVESQKEVVREALARHKKEPDVSTGHAFVVFLYEKDRNALVGLCRRGTLLRLWDRLRSACCNRDDRAGASLAGAELKRFARSTEGRGRMPTVDFAPEPDDVKWANLHMTRSQRRWRTGQALLVTLLLLVFGGWANVQANIAQANIGTDAGDGGDSGWLLVSYRLASSLLAALIPTVINLVLKLVLTRMTRAEGHDTETEYETSLFGKLSLAYTFNTAIIPLAVGAIFSWTVSGSPVNQSWYESGGVVDEAIFLMITNAIVTDLLKIVQPLALLRRYAWSPFVVSQERLNQLWAPPPMLLGELYAASLRTVALCLLYAPLWPFAYLLTACAMAVTFWCTKFAVSKWYRRPPMMSEEMMEKMRARLSMLMLLHTVVAAAGANAASSDAVAGEAWSLGTAASLPAYSMLALWCLYELVDLPGCFNLVPCLRKLNEADSRRELDTRGIPYRDDVVRGDVIPGVETTMGYEIDSYICPTAREGGRETSTDFLIQLVLRDFAEQRDFRGEQGDAAAAVSYGSKPQKLPYGGDADAPSSRVVADVDAVSMVAQPGAIELIMSAASALFRPAHQPCCGAPRGRRGRSRRPTLTRCSCENGVSQGT